MDEPEDLDMLLFREHQIMGCTVCKFARVSRIGVSWCCTLPIHFSIEGDGRCKKFRAKEED